MKNLKKLNVLLLVMVLLIGTMVVPNQAQAKSKKKVKLNKTSVTLTVGKTTTLKLKNAPKGRKVTWSSNKKKVATVTKKGKVTAKKAGKAKITAKVAGKKFTCTVKVNNVKSVPQDTTTEEVKDNTPNQPNVPSEPSNPTPTPDKPSDTVTPSQPSVDDKESWVICLTEGHTYKETVTPATCTSAAKVTKTCTRCGVSGGTSIQEGSKALGHNMVVKIKTEATCTKGSYETKECTRCHKEETTQLSTSLGHSYHTVLREEANCCRGEHLKQECTRCGDIKEYTDTKTNSSNHVGNGVTVTEVRTQKVGAQHSCRPGEGIYLWETEKIYRCAGCGAFINSTLTVPNITKEEYVQLIRLYGSDSEKQTLDLTNNYANFPSTPVQ